MLQDLKVGHILGGTPSKMQIGDLFGVVVASLVLFVPLAVLDKAYHFGSNALPAPQAGLMAMLSKGIVSGEMAWPLVVVGILLGLAMIMIEVKSVMLFSVGMYLPLGTTFAIFVGGIIRWVTDSARRRGGYNEAQTARIENVGILIASGMIAGEALAGLVTATFNFMEWPLPEVFKEPAYVVGLVVTALIAWALIQIPLKNAGDPNEPAPPAAIM
jgi:putative OPT family oligopeptide transporter